MAERNYFAHVDRSAYGMNQRINAAGFNVNDYLLQSKTANNFESIATGINRNTGKVMIQQLKLTKVLLSLVRENISWV